MKTYKMRGSKKILMEVCLSIAVIGGSFFIGTELYSGELSWWSFLNVLFVICVGLWGIYFCHAYKININDEEIVTYLPFKGSKTLRWDEIERADGFYFLYPDAGGISLIPFNSRKAIHITIYAIPIEMIKDILSHLPHGTTINLYPYLRRKVEGKQTWFYNE